MLIKNKYIRDYIIIEKYNLFNIIKLLRVIERNGFVVIYSKYGQEQSKLNFFKNPKSLFLVSAICFLFFFK